MAGNFSSAEDTCEGDDCEAITDVTYYVKENKKLCPDCASKEGCIGRVKKGEPNLYCEKHGKDIDMYCKTHDVTLCLVCASIYHHQQHCVRQDIEDAIMENKAKLNGLKEKAMDKLKSYRKYGHQILQCRQDADKHLQSIKCDLDSVINEAIKTDEEVEQKDAAKINQKFDAKNKKLQEEIRKNNEERNLQLKRNHTNAEKRREPVNNKQRDLHSDIEDIADVTQKKILEAEKSWKADMKNADNTVQKLNKALTDDRSVAKDGNRVSRSATEELKKPLDEDGMKRITRTVSDVRFVKGVGREKYNGSIDGYDGEWKLVDTISVEDEIKHPVLVGCVDEDQVIITDVQKDKAHTYMLDMSTNNIHRVITMGMMGDASFVKSCTLLNDEKVVCGKCIDCTGNSLPGCISVYDRHWKLINDVTIPRNTVRNNTWVDVAAGQDGMIIGAEAGQSKIYVINPGDGKITNTITCEENMKMLGVFSSGHIIALPSLSQDKVLIIDREGAHREIPASDVIWNVCVDPIADDLYVVTSDDEYKTCVVDQVMSGGDVKNRTIASFPLSTRLTEKYKGGVHLVRSRVMMTSSGNIIASDGDNILVFKKL